MPKYDLRLAAGSALTAQRRKRAGSLRRYPVYTSHSAFEPSWLRTANGKESPNS
jgi:hypothetical protein